MPLKIAVLGHHPDLFPGFNSLMAANFCYGFASEGHDVTLLLPNTESHPQTQRLSETKKDVSDLDRFGSEFDIRVVEADEDLGSYDLGVWQSYFQDDEAFWASFRKAVSATYKNFPRLFAGIADRDERSFRGAAGRFDIVGLALGVDLSIARQQFGEKYPEIVERFRHTPRGFRPDWFADTLNDEIPTIGVEKGVQTDGTEYAYLSPLISELGKRFGRIEVIGARIKDNSVITKTLPLLPAREFYQKFLSPLWVYAMIDINKSRQSMNALEVDGHQVYPGLYENQIVEAQMAGAAVIGQEDALYPELVGSENTGLRFRAFDENERMLEFLVKTIENRAKVYREARDWANRKHSISNMIEPILSSRR